MRRSGSQHCGRLGIAVAGMLIFHLMARDLDQGLNFYICFSCEKRGHKIPSLTGYAVSIKHLEQCLARRKPSANVNCPHGVYFILFF